MNKSQLSDGRGHKILQSHYAKDVENDDILLRPTYDNDSIHKFEPTNGPGYPAMI